MAEPGLDGSRHAAVSDPAAAQPLLPVTAASQRIQTSHPDSSVLNASSLRMEPSPGRSFLSMNASELSSGIICRICHEGESREELMSPCRCAGTMAMIHLSCIEKWLSSVNSDTCEICGFKYITEKRMRSMKDWLFKPGQHQDKRNLVGDFACFLLLTPLAAVSAWLCITGALHYAAFPEAKWETMGLIILTTFLIVIYFTWCGVALKYHVRVYRQWLKSNPIVKVLPRPENVSTELAVICDENNNLLSNPEHPSAETAFVDIPLAGHTASLPGQLHHLPRHMMPLAASSPLPQSEAWISKADMQPNSRSRLLASASEEVITTATPPDVSSSREASMAGAQNGLSCQLSYRETFV